jgi:hypothetical protein
MKSLSISAGLTAALLSVMQANFASAEEHEHRHHGAHVHGVARLNVAIEGKELYLELESPAMNLVGFEHMPSNHEQEAAVEKTVKTLEQGDRIFTIPSAANCKLVEAEVQSPLHEEQHGEHQGDKHEDDADHHDHEDGHSEFHAAYHFQCAAPAALTYIDVRLFKLFPETKDIDVQFISDKGQGAAELSASNHRLSF